MSVFAVLLGGVVLASAALAESAPDSPAAEANFDENLFTAFFEICLANRGSWNGASMTAERSVLKLKKTEIAKTREVEFSSFPLEVVLKRWGKKGYVCLAQSLVENSPAAAVLADKLKKSGPGLGEVSFMSVKGGLDGMLPRTAKGRQLPDVMVRVAPSILKDASTVQFLVSSENLEPPVPALPKAKR